VLANTEGHPRGPDNMVAVQGQKLIHSRTLSNRALVCPL